MTQVVLASTLYGAQTVAAAVDAGDLAGRSAGGRTPADGGTPPGVAPRRLLVVASTARVPEVATPLHRQPGFAAIASRFDEVVSWNALIAPYHPSHWAPRADDVPVWERLLRHRWSLGAEHVELIVESVQVPPARTLMSVFPDSPVQVYADGLMSYGPTRNRLPPAVSGRIDRLLHLDLVPDLAPLLLSEYAVPAAVIDAAAFRRVLTEVLAHVTADGTPGAAALAGLPAGPTVAVALGQYLSDLGILTPAEEEQLHLEMLTGAAAASCRAVVFKPHPAASLRMTSRLAAAARDQGIDLHVAEAAAPAEALFARLRPGLVVGCFSTALVVASRYFELPVARVGTGLLLERLTPYENSNRVPVTLIDATVPPLDPRRPTGVGAPPVPPEQVGKRLTPLLETVGYCMRSAAYPHLREQAVDYLTHDLDATSARYFKRRRLSKLGLPGGAPPRRTPRTVVLGLRRRGRRAALSAARDTQRRLERAIRRLDGRSRA